MKTRHATVMEADKVNEQQKGLDVLVNMIYGQMNMTAYMIGMVDKMLNRFGMEFNHEEKRLFNELHASVKRSLYLNQRMTEPIFKIGAYNHILQDSNQQMRIMLLLLDRTGGDETDLDLYEMELQRMPSKGIIGQDIIDRFKPTI